MRRPNTSLLVFALRNANLARHLTPHISSFIRDGSESETSTSFGHISRDLTSANYSSEPYLLYQHEAIDTEGPYRLSAIVSWTRCNVTGDQVSIVGSDSSISVDFSIKKGGQQVDLLTATAGLVAATADDTTCSAAHIGFALNVTDQVHQVPATLDGHKLSGTCAVLASPTPTANPCLVKIDTAAAASMSTSLQAALCEDLNPPADCPKENAAQRLAVAGVTSCAVAFGAVGFLLAAL